MTGEAAARRVLFYGDSLVAGVGDPAGGGWVARVVSAAFRGGVPLTAYNLGIRSETSIQVVARWREEAIRRVPAGADARIVVSFGANDTTIEEEDVRVSPDASSRALGEMLDGAAALGLAAYVVGPGPVDDQEQTARIIAVSESFAQVCRERGSPFTSTVESLLASPTWMAEVARADGAHPGTEGYDALAELLIREGLLAWLTEPMAT